MDLVSRDSHTLTRTGATVAGRAYGFGDTLGIAQGSAAADEPNVYAMPGSIMYAGATKHGAGSGQAWTVGLKLYWDSTNNRWTITASGNALGAIAAEVAATAATTGSIIVAPIIQT